MEQLFYKNIIEGMGFLTYGEVYDFLVPYQEKRIGSLGDFHVCITKGGTFCKSQIKNEFISIESVLQEFRKYTRNLTLDEYLKRRSHIFTIELNDEETVGVVALLLCHDGNIRFFIEELK